MGPGWVRDTGKRVERDWLKETKEVAVGILRCARLSTVPTRSRR